MSEHEVPSLILAIETSCDETAVAVCSVDGEVVISKVASQIDIHAPHGGVVPELASRNHNNTLRPLIEQTLAEAGLVLEDFAAVAATSGPGLASSLLIGDTTAKAIALGLNKPFYSVNHIEGHLLSPFIGSPQVEGNISLVVSGGHTQIVQVKGVNDYRILGSTLDDAAGEAFDKVGKMLGLPYPGGPEIDRRAPFGNPKAFDFPRSMKNSGDFRFSFSGIKTSVFYCLEKLSDPPNEETINDICASFQAAVVEILTIKTVAAAKQTGENVVTVSGGVSCNRGLRASLERAANSESLNLVLAEPGFSTDNAAMIAYTAAMHARNDIPPSPLDQDIDPNLRLSEITSSLL